MPKRRPLPKSQRELEQDALKGVSPVEYGTEKLNRGFETATTSDDPKPLSIGLEDIDKSIEYYFKNVIKPTVVQNGTAVEVPVYYGSPERWTAIQKQGYLRDSSKKLLLPLIVFKRTGITRNRSLTTKLDANNANQLIVYGQTYNKRNRYDNFTALNPVQNRDESKKLYVTAVPDYVDISYEVVLFTDFIHQMNKLTEVINYAADSYWGDPERFKFKTLIDSFSPTTEVTAGEDRLVRTTLNLTLKGYLLPDAALKDFSYNRITYSPSKIVFNVETITSDLSNPVSSAATDDSQIITETRDDIYPDADGGGDLG